MSIEADHAGTATVGISEDGGCGKVKEEAFQQVTAAAGVTGSSLGIELAREGWQEDDHVALQARVFVEATVPADAGAAETADWVGANDTLLAGGALVDEWDVLDVRVVTPRPKMIA